MARKEDRKIYFTWHSKRDAYTDDEYTDVSNKEQLTICLRWVDDYFESHEDFFGFYELKDIKRDTIVAAVIDVLLRTQISLDQRRGQCYDGASNMLRKKSGLAK